MSTLPTYDELADLLSEARTLLSSQERPPHPDQASHVIGFLDRADAALSPIAERTPPEPARSWLRPFHIEGLAYWVTSFSETISATSEAEARHIALDEAKVSDTVDATFHEFDIQVCYEVKEG